MWGSTGSTGSRESSIAAIYRALRNYFGSVTSSLAQYCMAQSMIDVRQGWTPLSQDVSGLLGLTASSSALATRKYQQRRHHHHHHRPFLHYPASVPPFSIHSLRFRPTIPFISAPIAIAVHYAFYNSAHPPVASVYAPLYDWTLTLSHNIGRL